MSRKTEETARANAAEREVYELEEKLARAEATLRGLGYEEKLARAEGVENLVWRLSLEAWGDQRAENKAVKEKHQRDIDAAVEKSRLDTLTAVIDALELSEYGYQRPGDGFAYPAVSNPRSPYFNPGPAGPERLWSDIETAIALRAEKKTDADRQAAAERINRVKPTRLFAMGGYTGTDGLPFGLVHAARSMHSMGSAVDSSATKKPKAKKKAAKK
jgi:hypothetical protein